MSEARTHNININKVALGDFADIEAGRVRRSAATGKDMRRAGSSQSLPGQMGGKMRAYEAAGLVVLTDETDDNGNRYWRLTEFGEAERARVTAEYEARRVG